MIWPTSAFPEVKQTIRLLENPERFANKIDILTLHMHRVAWTEICSWPGYEPTSLLEFPSIAKRSGISCLWYKDEGSRFGLGSFKALGGGYAVFRLLQQLVLKQIGRLPSSEELRDGSVSNVTRQVTVTTATDGNHGRAVAWAAQMFGCRCVIFVPKTCTPGREAAIARFGATVVKTSVGYDESVRQCAREASEKGFFVISDSSWQGYCEVPREVMNGYTVMVEEILNQLPYEDALTHVFIQAGVGALAAAVSAHLTNRLGTRAPALVVVEPDGAACFFASAQAGKAVPAPEPVATIMAGLECGEVSSLAWDILRYQATAFATLPDEVVVPTMRLLANPAIGDPKVVAGESSIAGLAALLVCSGDLQLRKILALGPNSRVLVIGSENNTDPVVYAKLVGTAIAP